ncbi:MAG: hypothetical protein QW175_05905 [Candidatus Bathyarchaeia archaeon]
MFHSKNLRVDPSIHQRIRKKFFELRQKTPASIPLSFIRFVNLIVSCGFKFVLERYTDEELVAVLAGQKEVD